MNQKEKTSLLRRQVEAILRAAALIAVASLLGISALGVIVSSDSVAAKYTIIPALIGSVVLVVIAFHYLINELIDIWGPGLEFLGRFSALKFLAIIVCLFSSLFVVLDVGLTQILSIGQSK